MGRPLTDRWIGQNPEIGSPVLMPICNIKGTIGPCWILGQVGAKKYIVQNVDDAELKGQIHLTNGTVDLPGTGYLSWETLHSNGYVKSITDRRIKTFSGATIEWSMGEPSETTARIVNSSIR